VIPVLAQKLIPRLASTHDGEVVATARALERVLRAEGFDWHDLARMAASAPLLRDRDLPESEYAKRVRSRLKEASLEDWLDSWSSDFLDSILQLRNLDMLSEKQTACVNKILRRASARQTRTSAG
jgi:hypothetical protein